MTQLLEIVRKLTDAELREVKDFAEFLLTRRALEAAGGARASTDRAIDFAGWAGCLAHVFPEKSDAQFNQLILDEWARTGQD